METPSGTSKANGGADGKEIAGAPPHRKPTARKSSKRDELFTKERALVQESASTRSMGSSESSRMSTSRGSLRTDDTRPSTPYDDSSDKEDLTGNRTKTRDQTANDAELRWPTNIRVFYNEGIKIRQQTSVIKTIIAESIHYCEFHMITIDAFPETGQREEFRFSMAKRAVKSLRIEVKHNKSYQDAYDRAKVDPKFLHKIGEVAVDRLAHHRSNIRSAANTQIGIYQLGYGTTCERRVATLLKGNVFIFDGHWGTENGQEVWLYDQQGPYLNPAIIQTIKNAWFGSGKTIGNNHPEAYTSSLPDHQDEKELPIALVALAVTTVHTALSSWKMGSASGKGVWFKGEIMATTYRVFCGSLESLKASKPVLFHRIMNTLFKSVCVAHTEDSRMTMEDPLAVLDLVDL